MEDGAIEEPFRTRYDAVVVGSGAGGSTLAYRLATRGLQVLVVERGDYLKPGRQGLSEAPGIYQYHLGAGGPDGKSFVGGQTKFYGSALYRMRESDFQSVEHESGISPAWPITYWDLEPYYQEAEALYAVHGSPAGDPSEPPRRRAFPHAPISHGPIVSELVERIERLGVSVAAIPRGLDYGPGGKCILCATCDAHYCQLDAKMDAEIAALRPALATGNVRVAVRTECLRVLTDRAGGHVTGVVIRRQGKEATVFADVVAVCAAIPGSAVLLRRSRTNKHPQGLGNDYGNLGRYLAGHSVGMIFPIVSWKKLPPLHTKTFAINGYYHGAPEWPFPLGVIQVAGQIPFWEKSSRLMRPLAQLVGTHALTCFYMTEALATRDSGLLFEGDLIGRRIAPVHNAKSFAKLRELAVGIFRRAGYPTLAPRRVHDVWHEVGTARAGTSPETSVVDMNCQVHGIEGLFVMDCSVLPSAGAVNTALTIIALALRAGDFIARRAADPEILRRSSDEKTA